MANKNISVEVRVRRYFLGLDHVVVIGLVAGHFFCRLYYIGDLNV